ncbi:RHS repeat-associated core domain-containing protein, partial [Pseudomonas gessardii]
LLEGFGPANTQAFHYQLDHLGTPQELTNAQGKIVWSAHYLAYGQIARLDVGTVDNPLRFQGQYFDQESGLHYNRHRYYNPDNGRYLTPDPVKLAGGVNGYLYVPNPTGWVDPLGLTCKAGNCPGQKNTRPSPHNEESPPSTSGQTRFTTYEQASNKAMEWLLENDFRAEKPTLGKFGTSDGHPIGMQTIDGKTGYRVEFDERSGAHINVWSGKKKGPHYLFQGSAELVLKINRRFAKK